MTELQNRFFAAANRAAAMIDQNPLSPTAGCADRSYWHYKDGKGFAVGSFQVAMLGLWGASRSFPAFADRFRDASLLARSWWAKETLRRAALDEYFANQRSFCATAYSALAAAAVTTLEVRSGAPLTQQPLEALAKATGWLHSSRNQRPDSANQSFAAAIAWDLAGQLDTRSSSGTSAERNPFLPTLSPEGWFPEYGGFDLGYSLKCVDLCALALGLIEDSARRKPYEDAARALLDFLQLVSVGFTFSAALGSRGNPQRLLGGLHLFAAGGDASSAAVLEALQSDQRFPSYVPAEACDDKYLAFFHLTSLMLGTQSVPDQPIRIAPRTSPFDPPRSLSLPKAGLYFVRSSTSRCAISARSGGAVCVESEGKSSTRAGLMVVQRGAVCIPAQAEMTINETEGAASLELFVRHRPERHALLQSQLFRLVLTGMLAVPVLGDRLRQKIFREMAPSVTRLHAGKRTVRWKSGAIVVEDTVDAGFDSCFSGEWQFEDGHATRMFWKGGPALKARAKQSP